VDGDVEISRDAEAVNCGLSRESMDEEVEDGKTEMDDFGGTGTGGGADILLMMAGLTRVMEASGFQPSGSSDSDTLTDRRSSSRRTMRKRVVSGGVSLLLWYFRTGYGLIIGWESSREACRHPLPLSQTRCCRLLVACCRLCCLQRQQQDG